MLKSVELHALGRWLRKWTQKNFAIQFSRRKTSVTSIKWQLRVRKTQGPRCTLLWLMSWRCGCCVCRKWKLVVESPRTRKRIIIDAVVVGTGRQKVKPSMGEFIGEERWWPIMHGEQGQRWLCCKRSSLIPIYRVHWILRSLIPSALCCTKRKRFAPLPVREIIFSCMIVVSMTFL